jgi:signal transduction histidine kinase/ActR/RegA family two-component response regulator
MAADKSPGAKAGRDGHAAEPRLSLRALNIALAVVGASLFVAVALLFYIQWQQRSWLEAAQENQEPSVAARIQELDAEVTRLRETLSREQAVGVAPDTAPLQANSSALLARLSAIQALAAADQVLSRPESTLTLERVQRLQTRTKQWLEDPNRDGKDLVGLASISQGLAQPLANLLASAKAIQKQQADAQYARLSNNASDIFQLSVLCLLLTLLTVGTLLLQNRQRALAQEKSRKLTEYFRETQLKAETASRGKSRFLANMSHELRTPFNGIFGMLSLLGTTPLDAMQADYLKTANASANHLLNVLNDILDLSALEEGKISLQFAPLDVRQVVRDISDVMRPQAEQKKLDFDTEIHPDVPQWLTMDAKRLKQILFNLSNNAVKFTSRGGVQIKVKLGAPASSDNKDYVLLDFSVEDSGIGISSDALENLFQRFNQVHNGISNDYGGTGLGLEISQSLAQLMGGQIEVTSAKGVGSCFTLRLRAQLAQAPLPTSQRKVFQLDAPTKPERLYRILVVEDNEVNRKFVDILLKRMGYLTYFAENGRVAINRIQKQSFDLVLMDLHMPVMNGIEATRAIRALAHPAAKIPIIALTADVMNDAHEEALAAGVNDFVTKPVHMGRLQDMIRQHLEPGSEAPGAPQS